MTAFNVVRFRVKPGREEQFVNAHRDAEANFPGMRRVALVKTGERAYCVIGEWEDTASLAGAREQMIALLNRFRDTLEDLGGGVTPLAAAFQPPRPPTPGRCRRGGMSWSLPGCSIGCQSELDPLPQPLRGSTPAAYDR